MNAKALNGSTKFAPGRESSPSEAHSLAHGAKKIDFSLFYFSSDDGRMGRNKYRLLVEGAKFADEHGFSGVWTPERHFHNFGGLYPNPSVTGAAIAMVTRRVQIRAGSLVLPLHHPVRAAEEWAVVDNLSGGRVAVSFASGWHQRDFVIAPGNYRQRKEVMFDGIETVRKLWRGESTRCLAGDGREVEVKIFPRPIQPELDVWVTVSGNPDTFRKAGEIGANLLTHLLGQSMDELAAKIRIYRDSFAQARGGSRGRVALMLHTFIGHDVDVVREMVRKPFCDYLKSSADLLQTFAVENGQRGDYKCLSPGDVDLLVRNSFERHFGTSNLLGTAETCLPLVHQLKMKDVDEIACLIDFGVDADDVLANLTHLNQLRELSNGSQRALAGGMTPALSQQAPHFGSTRSQPDRID